MMPPLTFPAASLTPATYVVDTNVILVANGQHPDVSPACVTACQDWLQRIMAEGRVALDDAYAIVGEYQHKTHASDGQGVGDAFVRWVLQHVDDAARCDLVNLSPDAGRGFLSFPVDEGLAHFDDADRKFVAVAHAHPERPPILQAADSKWLDWAPHLADHSVQIRFLCQAEVQEFHHHKFGC
ncbi:hypothetical protein [Aquabacterium sp.]|jgi:hypothetical protein|uniref:hypothetical protein n=1 Tax=Aquabacterium sp. TaxID=1872578 RepID=UPI003BB0804B